MFGIVSQARRVQTRLRSLAQLNVELAQLEAKRKAGAVGVAGALGLAAVVLIAYAVLFALGAAAAALSTTFSVWLSLLIVAGGVLLVAAIAGLLAKRFAKKATVPWAVADEAQRTVKTLQDHA